MDVDQLNRAILNNLQDIGDEESEASSVILDSEESIRNGYMVSYRKVSLVLAFPSA